METLSRKSRYQLFNFFWIEQIQESSSPEPGPSRTHGCTSPWSTTMLRWAHSVCVSFCCGAASSGELDGVLSNLHRGMVISSECMCVASSPRRFCASTVQRTENVVLLGVYLPDLHKALGLPPALHTYNPRTWAGIWKQSRSPLAIWLIYPTSETNKQKSPLKNVAWKYSVNISKTKTGKTEQKVSVRKGHWAPSQPSQKETFASRATSQPVSQGSSQLSRVTGWRWLQRHSQGSPIALGGAQGSVF